MNTTHKQIISVLGAVALFVVFIYGSYLPMRKSMRYIDASRATQSVKSLDEFRAVLDPALTASSPIGQNEIVRNVGSMVLTIVRNGAQNAPLVDAAVNYLMTYYKPIIEYGRGPSFSQDLYILGLINESAYISTRDVKYLDAARAYFEEGNRRGPDRAQFLYGLFDIHRFANDAAKTEMVTNELLRRWPNDTNIQKQYKNFLDRMSTSSTASTSAR